MKYRIWFNKGNTDPQQAWVIESCAEGHQIVAADALIQSPSNLVVDFKSCPQSWIETDGFLTIVDGHVAIEVLD